VASVSGYSAVLLAAALWGTTGTAQSFAPGGASAVSVGAARLVFGGLLLLVIGAQGTGLRSLLTRRSDLGVVLLGGTAVAAYQGCFFFGVARTGVAVGTVVAIGSAPVLTGLLARFFHRAPLTGRWALSTAVATAGCAALVLGGRASGVDVVGVGFALLAGLCYAVYAIAAARLITAGAPSRAVMAAVFGTGALLLVPVLLGSAPRWLVNPIGLAVAVHLAVVTTAVAYLLYGRGLRSTPVSVAATLSLAEPAVAAMLGLLVLREPLSATSAVGLTLVGLALAVLAAPRGGENRCCATRPPRADG
jgi:DME family drug/metabolite transporter